MIFRQLFDLQSSTYTYLIGCEKTKQAVLIDPVFEQARRDIALLNELGLSLSFSLETHCHADHVTSAWLLKQKTGAQICSAGVINAGEVDRKLSDGDVLQIGTESLTVIATPGHTDGCLTYVTSDKKMAFTGDTILIRGCGRCDFQQGNAVTMFHSITEKIFTLPDDCELYPGHDYNGRTKTTVGEEKQFNTRIGGGASLNDFVGFMNAMQLPHPKMIDHAVPANLVSGKPEISTGNLESLESENSWAPINYTFSGVPEVDAQWVIHNRNAVQVLDVREKSELEDEPGNVNAADRIIDAQNIPLSELRERLSEVSKELPVVCLCRSGRRSAMAVSILQKDGVEKIANVRGGVLSWLEFG